MIENNFYQKMSVTNEDNINSMDFVLNLDILNGCVHSCDGCYVKKFKEVNNWEQALEKAYKIAEEMTAKGLRFRELILGPTDIFSAENTEQVLRHPTFQKLLRLNEKTRITAACIFDGIDKDHFLKLFSILDDETLYRKEMILEFLVPLNTKKMLDQEDKYMTDNKWVLNFFKNNSPKVIDWSYVINIHNNELLKANYDKAVSIIKNEFNTILEFNPGFFRTNNERLINKNMLYWKDFLSHILEKEDYRNVYLTNVDMYHNTSNTICLNLYQDEVYFSPFIYEQILDTHESFRVTDLSAEFIMQKHVELQALGFAYANKTTECTDCKYLTACAGRNVLNFMENKGIKDCVFPKKFKEIGE